MESESPFIRTAEFIKLLLKITWEFSKLCFLINKVVVKDGWKQEILENFENKMKRAHI